jgi:MFS family permease
MLVDWRIVRTFQGNLIRLLISWGLLAFAYFGVQGVLLNLYLLRLGYGLEFIGNLTASGQILWGVLALPAAMLGRRIGPKRVMMSAFALLILGTSVLLLAEILPRPLWSTGLIAGWLLMWSGAALKTVNSAPLVMAVTTNAERPHAFSAQAGLLTLMGFAGAMAAGFLQTQFTIWLGAAPDDPAPYRYTLWLVPIFYLLCFLVWTTATPVTPYEENRRESSRLAPWGFFLFFGLVVILQTASEGLVRTFFNIYLDQDLHLPTLQIGVIMGLGQLLPVAMALVAPWLLERWGTTRTLIAASIGVSIALLPLGLSAFWPIASLGFIGVLSMRTLSASARGLFGQQMVEPRWRASIAAVGTIATSISWAVSAAGGGYLIASWGFRSLFLFSIPVALSGALVLFAYLRRHALPLHLPHPEQPNV